jgi:hypothetical protein
MLQSDLILQKKLSTLPSHSSSMRILNDVLMAHKPSLVDDLELITTATVVQRTAVIDKSLGDIQPECNRQSKVASQVTDDHFSVIMCQLFGSNISNHATSILAEQYAYSNKFAFFASSLGRSASILQLSSKKYVK